MRSTSSFLACAFLALLPAAPRASAATINFDNLVDSTIVTNQYSGLTFSDAVVLTSGISLNEFEFPPHSGTNVVSDNGGPLSIAFAVPITSLSGYFTYAEPLTLIGVNARGTEVVSAATVFSDNMALSGVIGSSPNELLSLAFASGISSVIISGDPAGGSFVLDDLSYSSAAPVTTTPEPASFLSFSLGLLAYILLRRYCDKKPLHPGELLSKGVVAILTFAACSGVTPARAALPPVPTPTTDKQIVYLSEPTVITVTVPLVTRGLIPASENVVRYDQDQNPLGLIGQLYDDGTHGDSVAGDGIYTTQVAVNEAAPGEFFLRVSAAYTGSLQRALSGFTEIDAVEHLTPPNVGLITPLANATAQLYVTYLSKGLMLGQAQQQTLAWLIQQPGVVNAGTSGNGGPNLWIQFSTGIFAALEFYEPDSGSTIPIAATSGSVKLNSLGASLTAALPAVGSATQTAARISPYDSEFGSNDEGRGIAATLRKGSSTNCGISVDEYINQQATVGRFKNLSNYSTLIITSHGDTYFADPTIPHQLIHNINGYGGQPVIVTAQPVNEPVDLTDTSPYYNDLESGALLIVFRHPLGVALPSGQVVFQSENFGVTAKFIQTYYHPSGQQGVVYVGSCRSAFNRVMADAFLTQRSVAYFGYSEYESNEFANRVGNNLFNNLEKNDTASQARASITNNTDTDPSPWYAFKRSDASLVDFYGSPSYTLPTCKSQSLLDIRNDNGQPGSFLLELPEGQPPFAVSIPNNSSKDYDISDLTGPGPFTLKIKATAGFASIILTLPTGFQFLDGTTQQGQYIVSILTSLSVATFTFEAAPVVSVPLTSVVAVAK